MEVTVLNRQRKRRVDTRPLRLAAETMLTALDQPNAELTVTLVSDKRIHTLNRAHRGVDRPTDVLSFPQREGDPVPRPEGEGLPDLLGDVVISTETAARQGAERASAGTGEADALLQELIFLTLHGLLHLLGHTHDEDDDHERMEEERRRVWAALIEADLVDADRLS